MIRAAFKSLLARKVRLLMSTFAIVLGVSFVVGTLIFSDTLNRSFVSLFAYTVGDVVVQPEGGDTPGGETSTVTIPASLVDTLATLPGAARADGRIGVTGVYVVSKEGKAIGGFGPPSFGGNWSDAPAGNGLQGLTITEGHAPEGPDEVVLDARLAEKSGWQLGDQVPIITVDETANVTATLVGIADFPDGGSLNGSTLAEFETPRAQQLFVGGEDAYNTVWVTAKDGVSQEQLQAQVEAALPDGLEAVTGDSSADDKAAELLDAISFLTIFLLVFAGIALLVGAFLIVNTFSILVAQRSRELALLRALGASRRQVTRSVQLESFVLGALGATAGLGLGVLMAVALRALFANFGLDLSGQSLVIAPRTVIAAYGVGVLVTMAAAWFPARRTSRISPVQAMRDDIALPEESLRRRLRLGFAVAVVGGGALAVGVSDAFNLDGRIWYAAAGMVLIFGGVIAMSPVLARPFLTLAQGFYARVFGSIGNLAGQNALRNPRRTAATASALMIGLTLACMMSIVGASAKATVDKQIEDTFVGDYIVSSVFAGPFSSSIATRLENVDGVADVVQQRFGFAKYDGGFAGIGATAPDDIDRLDLTLDTGKATDLAAPDTVLLGKSFADSNDLVVGDSIKLEVNAGTVTWKVVGTFEASTVIDSGILTSVRTMESAGYPARDNLLVVYAEPGATGLQARLDKALANQPIVTAKDQSAYAAERRKPIDQSVLIIFALLGLALLIAVLGIVNTLALSVIERTREVGLLRAIGVSRRQLRLMITLESVVISLLGALLGVILGIGFGVALMTAVRDQGLDVISVPWGQVVMFLVVSVIVGVAAAVLPGRRAARLDVLKAIATD
ncbi:FtsX-like permease family protein [soil metagenome]